MLDHGQRQSNGSPEMAAVLAPVRSASHLWNDGPARGGAPLTYTIPPTLPQDAELQRDFFRTLSAESRYGRFLTPLKELPENMTRRFASIDYTSHLALLAEVFVGGRQTMIGEARYIVDGCDPAACEFAIAVADVWQLRGLGNVLLDRLERQAAASGIQRMVADTLRANRAMIGLAAQAGYAVRASREDAMLARLEKRLAPPAATLPS
jgi:acetyltransferase